MAVGEILGVTGHRDLGYSLAGERLLYELALSCLADLKPRTVVTGMALGWDTAVALAALERKLKVWAFIPFKGQEDKWSTEQKHRYAQILSKTERTVYLSGEGYTPQKMLLRNKAIVDESQRILALYDGRHSGGTDQCVSYAMSIGRPVVNAFPRFQRLDKGFLPF